jgi:hypothetical protein
LCPDLRHPGKDHRIERGKVTVGHIRSAWGLVACVSGAAAASIATATPAGAVASPVLAPAVGLPTAAAYNVTPQCNAGPGVATNLDQVTYVIVATAFAYSTDGTPAAATGVTCKVVDAVTGEVYGRATGALPGAAAVAASPVTVPLDSTPRLCGSANALFMNNAVATGYTTPRC